MKEILLYISHQSFSEFAAPTVIVQFNNVVIRRFILPRCILLREQRCIPSPFTLLTIFSPLLARASIGMLKKAGQCGSPLIHLQHSEVTWITKCMFRGKLNPFASSGCPYCWNRASYDTQTAEQSVSQTSPQHMRLTTAKRAEMAVTNIFARWIPRITS